MAASVVAPSIGTRNHMETEEAEDQFACSVCGKTAMGFCCCRNEKTKLCLSCFSEHYESGDSDSHTYLPPEAFDYISPLVPIADFLERCRVVTTLTLSLATRISRLEKEREDYLCYLSSKEQEMICMVKTQIAKDQADACTRINKEIARLKAIIGDVERARGELDLGEDLSHLLIRTHEITSTAVLSDTTKFKVNIATIETELAQITSLTVFSFENYFRKALAASKIYYFSFNSNIMSIYEPKSNIQKSHTLQGGKNIPEKACWCNLQSGFIFVCGGFINNTYQSLTLLVDPTNLSIDATAQMTQARRSHGLIEYQGHVYAFGGYNGALLNSAEKYNLRSAQWSPIASMKTARNFVMPALMQGKIYLVGYDGNGVERYDPSVDECRTLEVTLPVSNAYTAVFGCEAALIILQTTNLFLYDVGEDGQLRLIKSSIISKNAGWFTYGAPIYQSNKFYFYNYADSSYYSVRQHGKNVKLRMLLTTTQ